MNCRPNVKATTNDLLAAKVARDFDAAEQAWRDADRRDTWFILLWCAIVLAVCIVLGFWTGMLGDGIY